MIHINLLGVGSTLNDVIYEILKFNTTLITFFFWYNMAMHGQYIFFDFDFKDSFKFFYYILFLLHL